MLKYINGEPSATNRYKNLYWEGYFTQEISWVIDKIQANDIGSIRGQYSFLYIDKTVTPGISYNLGYPLYTNGIDYSNDPLDLNAKINIDKLKNIEFNTTFKLTYNALQTLIKGSSFASEVNKIFFNTTATGKVRGELTDCESQNVNSFSVDISDSFKGDPIPSPKPLTFEVIRFILTTRFEECTVHHSSDLNVFLFDISDDGYTINYIASGLRK